MSGSARLLKAWTRSSGVSWQLATGRLGALKQLDLARIWREMGPRGSPRLRMGPRRRRDLGLLLARLEGLEPPAGCLEGSCSIRLSYRRP
jgi:hypothetical protein